MKCENCEKDSETLEYDGVYLCPECFKKEEESDKKIYAQDEQYYIMAYGRAK